MDPEGGFEDFLKERSEILKDIEQFLFMVFRYFSKMAEEDFDPEFFITETVRSLIKSLCLIHGLYGYPAHASNIAVNKQAVKGIVLNKIKENGKAFVDFYKEANEDNFWQFNLEESPTNISLREPAHIFLQLVRDPYENANDHSLAAITAKIGQKHLESLPDINFLKPVVWAEHKEKPECCGVSLGVRTFVRPLFLYLKLIQLRNVECGHNGVNLKDVKAYKSALKREFLLNPADPPRNKKSEYNNEIAACQSCCVFFSHYELSLNNQKNPSFTPFGNCAEYDVIRTNNLDSLLLDLAHNTEEWALFETACQHHFKAFNELTASLQEAEDPCERIKAYYKNTSDAKILKYRMIGPAFKPQFTLVAKNWRPDRRQAKTNKKKRRKTVV